MTTVVFGAKTGGVVQQVHVGAADIVALVSAAHSAWGWIGGLDGMKGMLDKAKAIIGYTHSKHAVSSLASLNIPKASYHIFTSSGLIFCQDGQKSFGGDPTMQFVGVTLCALAHELGDISAIKLFMQCMAPTLFSEEFSKIHVLKEAMQLQLMDHIVAILNEGAVRGYPEQFRIATGVASWR